MFLYKLGVGNIRDIKEISAFGRYAITDSGSPDGMLHRNCLKFQLTDGRDASRLHLAQLGNRIPAEEIQCLQSRINTTRCPLGKPGCVIGMGVGEQNRRRRNASELSKPVCPAIHHDTRPTVLDEERAMISMSPGAKLDASSGPEKGQLHMCLAYLVCDANAQSRRNRQCNSSIWPFTEAPEAKDASGIIMKDWNVVITVNDSESFRKARQEFQRFGDGEPTDYRNVLVLRVPNVPKFGS